MEIDNPTITKIANLTSNGVVTTSGGDGTLGVSAPGGGVAPYATTFDATTSWGAASGGLYSIAVTHNLGTTNIIAAFYDTATEEQVFPENVVKTSDNVLTFSVSEVPDNRFAGRVVIMTGAAAVSTREMLSAARTYYVRTDGNDSNTGLVNTSGGAFLTIQKAVNAYQALDCNGYDVTIQVADGTYAGGTLISGRVGTGNLYFTGNVSTPANVLLSTGSSACIAVLGHPAGSTVTIDGVKLVSSSIGLQVASGSTVAWRNVNFGACSIHIYSDGASVVYNPGVAYTISGGALSHFYAVGFGHTYIAAAVTVTVTGTPAFSLAFAYSASGIVTVQSVTWSGSATGKRYSAVANGIVDTGGQATTWLPGNVAGTTATGGQYL